MPICREPPARGSAASPAPDGRIARIRYVLPDTGSSSGPPTGSDPAAAASPRGRGPTASSNSRHLSFSIVWRTSSRRRGSTGTAITGCLRESQAETGRHFARDREHRQAARGRDRRAWGRRMPRKAAVPQIRVTSPARTTPHGLRGRSSWPGWGRSFRSSAQRAAAISDAEETAGRRRLTSNRRFASGRRHVGWEGLVLTRETGARNSRAAHQSGDA